MLVSLKACRNYVDIKDLSAKDIAEGLTNAGVEVEKITTLASGTNLVIGEIIECEAHPNSDHLHILKVNLGEKHGIQQIVCGAPNARKGLKVIVSLVGAMLPLGEIKKSVIRGVESNGMCCSLLELGVDPKYLNENQQKGIEELPSDARVGNENVLEYLNFDDEILDISVLANRSDLLSLYNVCREIGAIFNRKVTIPKYDEKYDYISSFKVATATDACQQFSVKEVKNIVIKKSPNFIIQTLNASGIRSINNIVDIGNYVMLLTGQPLHMYDMDKLPKHELVVKADYEGDFIALDEKTYHIVPNDVVITSNDDVYCLGGVMGSLKCAVDEKSSNIVIESASFNGANIRHTSSRLGLSSESSTRFVKGTNHFQYEDVLNFACDLLIKYADAKAVSNIVTVINEKKIDTVVNTNIDRINKRLGTHLSYDEITNPLIRLGFKLESSDEKELICHVPPHRLDIYGYADICEEVIRLVGFDKIELDFPNVKLSKGGRTVEQKRCKIVKDYLVGCGLFECLTYSLVNHKNINIANMFNNDTPKALLNPLTDEHEVLRTNLLGSLLTTTSYNINRSNKDLGLFEIANIYTNENSYQRLAIALVGNKLIQGQMKKESYNFYHAKGIIEGLFEVLGIEKTRYRFEIVKNNINDVLHPGRSADIIFQNQLIGKIGELHPNLIEKYDLGKTRAVVIELNLPPIINAKISVSKVSPISKFPSINRDIAMIINNEITTDKLIKTIKTFGKSIVKDVYVFDVYQDETLKVANKKSVAISIIFNSDEKTLTDEEINSVFDNIKHELIKAYNAEIRIG